MVEEVFYKAKESLYTSNGFTIYSNLMGDSFRANDITNIFN